MNKLIIGVLFITCLIGIASAVTPHYTQIPSSCPATDPIVFPGLSCTPTNICGYGTGGGTCYDTSTITMPSTWVSGYQTQRTGTGYTGYVLDCYNPASCVNSFYCGTNSTCETWNRPTNCSSTTVAPCSASCKSNYYDCDGDPNTCEIQGGSACTSGGLPGTYSGCVCVTTPQHFITATEAKGATILGQALLWGTNLGVDGLLANLTNSSGSSFLIDNNGCVKLGGMTDFSCNLTSSGGDSLWMDDGTITQANSSKVVKITGNTTIRTPVLNISNFGYGYALRLSNNKFGIDTILAKLGSSGASDGTFRFTRNLDSVDTSGEIFSIANLNSSDDQKVLKLAQASDAEILSMVNTFKGTNSLYANLGDSSSSSGSFNFIRNYNSTNAIGPMFTIWDTDTNGEANSRTALEVRKYGNAAVIQGYNPLFGSTSDVDFRLGVPNGTVGTYYFSRNLDSAHTSSPVLQLSQLSASDDQNVLNITNKGTGKSINANGESHFEDVNVSHCIYLSDGYPICSVNDFNVTITADSLWNITGGSLQPIDHSNPVVVYGTFGVFNNSDSPMMTIDEHSGDSYGYIESSVSNYYIASPNVYFGKPANIGTGSQPKQSGNIIIYKDNSGNPSLFYNSTSDIFNFSVNIFSDANISANEFMGKLNWSWLQNVPDYLLSSDQRYNETDLILGINTTLWDAKLDKTDQRYNDTSLILGVNSSIWNYLSGLTPENASWNQSFANTLYYSISNPLNFVNRTQTDTYYYNISNPLNFINKTQGDEYYAPIGTTGGNASFNQTLTDARYVPYSGANADVDLGEKNFFAKNIQSYNGTHHIFSLSGDGGGVLSISHNANDDKIFLEGSNRYSNASANEMLLTGYLDSNLPTLSIKADDVNISNQLNVNGMNVNKWLYNQTTPALSYVAANYINKFGDSATGDYNFNGGWLSNGLTISGGNIYAQTLYVYNISSISVSTINTNGSIIPTLNAQFDLGSATKRWKNAYFSGIVNASNFTGDGSGLTGLLWSISGSYAKMSTPAIIDLQNYRIVNVTNPVLAQDAATKAYVDATAGLWSIISSQATLNSPYPINMLNKSVTNVSNPVNPQDVATKAYVDSSSNSIIYNYGNTTTTNGIVTVHFAHVYTTLPSVTVTPTTSDHCRQDPSSGDCYSTSSDAVGFDTLHLTLVNTTDFIVQNNHGSPYQQSDRPFFWIAVGT